MIIRIENEDLEALYQDKTPKGKPKFSKEIVEKFKKTINRLKYSDTLPDIKKQRSLNFEALKGDLKGKYSVRVDIKYRLILRIEKDRVVLEDILVIEDLTNHNR